MTEAFVNVPASARAAGEVRASFSSFGAMTQPVRIFETGGLRLRFPRVQTGPCEAVLVNTAGGIVGGDRALYSFELAASARLMLTSQSAEKIYRAQSEAEADCARIEVALRAESGARLEWLPQEAILFDGARLTRRLDVDLASDAEATLIESVVFGRGAMGESVTRGLLRDRWRVRREGRLVFAEELAFDGAISSILDRPACADGGRGCATLLHVSQLAEERLEPLRDVLAEAACEWGASAWNGLLVLRLVAVSPEDMRKAMLTALKCLRGCDAPRVWT